MIPQRSRSVGGQLCLQFPPNSPRVEVLLSSQIFERFGAAPSNLHQIKIGQCVAYENYRIWHRGKNLWEVIRIN